MIKKQLAANEQLLLDEIASHQLLQGGFNSNLGLLAGKMGNCIFLLHYARFSGNSLYEDFAGELINDIYEDINVETPWGFGKGLISIGWGVEYLVQTGFVEGDTDDILSDIDEKIMERDVKRINDYSFDTGLDGLAWYILIRLLSSRKNGKHPFDKKYLNDLNNICRKTTYDTPKAGISLLSDHFMGKQIKYPYAEILQKIISWKNMEDESEKLSWREGLKMILQ